MFTFKVAQTQQTNIKFGHLSIKDGLSQSDVLSILQDKKGLMWFGTQDGLNQYTGFEFVNFAQDIQDSLSISNSFIHELHEDNNGQIWAATENGLNIFQRKNRSFKNIIKGKFLGKSKNNVWALAENADYIWAGTDEGLLKIHKTNYSIETITIENALKNKTLKVRDLVLMGNELFIATEGNGLLVYNIKAKTNHQYTTENSKLLNNTVLSISQLSQNQLWIGTNKGICVIENKSKKIIDYPIINKAINNASVTEIFEDKSGIIWIGTEQDGLYKVHSSDNIDHYLYDATISTSLSSNKINHIYEDNSGIIWIGTQSGVDKFDKQKQYFKHFKLLPNNTNTISSNMVWSIFQDDATSRLFVGTNKGLDIFNYEGNKISFVKPIFKGSSVIKNESVYSICKDHNQKIYIGTDGGIFEYVNNTLIAVDFLNSKQRNRTYSILEDKKHRLWIGTREGLLLVSADRKTTKSFVSSPDKNDLKVDLIRFFAEDKSGNIWIGTDGGGLSKVIEQGDSIAFKTYLNNPAYINSLSNNSVLSMLVDNENNIWIGTFGGGLNKFNTKTEEFVRFTEKDGLANNVIYGVLIDEKNTLWISTNKGLSSFNTKTQHFKNYDESDGLQSNEFNVGAFYKNKNNELFFGGINGFNAFYPKDVHVNNTQAKPLITNFYLFNKQVKIGGADSILPEDISELNEITLKYRQNVISFEFVSLHYSHPQKNQHAYKLENFNDDWVHIGNNRIANYTNLDPGEYIFKVKVSNNDGIWNNEIAQIKIIVLPPIWATWWFRTISILFILAIIYAYYITRINRVKAQKLLLEVQVRERTYEVIKQKEEIEHQKKLIEEEKEKTEKLLLNILPEETVEELKSKGKATARQYRLASIMFTDFKSFTKIAEQINPQDLVAELDRYFIEFDSIIQKYNIEKIKTIGDAYMCSGGIPIRNKSNPIDIVLAGLDIQRYMQKVHNEKVEKGEKPWGLRIGIHTGEIIAGVVGIKRFAYDIWGDSVNIASRIEAAGEVGKVNISGTTYFLVKEFFDCEYRGKVKAKNKGYIDMYFVHRIRKELSVNGEGKVPNELFYKYVNLHIYSGINYRKAEKYIVERLKVELPENLYYHDLRHTLDVCAAVERLALMEGVEGDNIFLLKTAALYHDAGFVKQYSNNEEIGADLAKEVLPRFGYTDEQIEVIHQLINATKIPHKPNNKLEEIMCDADLDYLGGGEFHPISEKLKHELMEREIVKTDKQWDELQIKFLEAHKYFTKTAIKLNNDNKSKRIEEIKERLKNYE